MSSLIDYCPKSPPFVPPLLVHCFAALERDHINQEGIYRISGPQAAIKELYQQFTSSQIVPDLTSVRWEIITGCIKMFLKGLQDSVIQSASYNDFLQAVEGNSEEAITQCIYDLPVQYRDTLAYLILHLQKVASHSAQNKMSIENLATVLAPTIVGYLFTSKESAEDLYIINENQTVILLRLLELSTEFWNHSLEMSAVLPAQPRTPGSRTPLLTVTPRTPTSKPSALFSRLFTPKMTPNATTPKTPTTSKPPALSSRCLTPKMPANTTNTMKIPFAAQWTILQDELPVLEESKYFIITSTETQTTFGGVSYYLQMFPNGTPCAPNDATMGKTYIALRGNPGDGRKVEATYSMKINSAQYPREMQTHEFDKMRAYAIPFCGIHELYASAAHNRFFIDGKLIFEVDGIFEIDDEAGDVGMPVWNVGKLLWEADDSRKDFSILSKEKEFKVHKFVLALRSPHFADLFKRKPLLIQIDASDLSSKCVELALKIIYGYKLVVCSKKEMELIRKFYKRFETPSVKNIYKSHQHEKGIVDIPASNIGPELWKKMTHIDVTIIVDGREIKAHKAVLAVASTFFEDFCDPKEITQNPIKLQEPSFRVVGLAIKGIYESCTYNCNDDETIALFQFCKDYGIPSLKNAYEKILIERISVENVCNLMSYAVESGPWKKIREKCMEFLLVAFAQKTHLHDSHILDKDVVLEILQKSVYQVLDTKYDDDE